MTVENRKEGHNGDRRKFGGKENRGVRRCHLITKIKH
jgi:hypothetical protein